MDAEDAAPALTGAPVEPGRARGSRGRSLNSDTLEALLQRLGEKAEAKGRSWRYLSFFPGV